MKNFTKKQAQNILYKKYDVKVDDLEIVNVWTKYYVMYQSFAGLVIQQLVVTENGYDLIEADLYHLKPIK